MRKLFYFSLLQRRLLGATESITNDWMGDILSAGYRVRIPSTGVSITTSLNHRQAVKWRNSLLAAARKGKDIAVMGDLVIHRSAEDMGMDEAEWSDSRGPEISFLTPIANFPERWAEFATACAKPSNSEQSP